MWQDKEFIERKKEHCKKIRRPWNETYSWLGKRHTTETKRKIGEASRNRKRCPRSEETKLKIKLALTGKKRKPLSEESNLKISKAHKGKVLSEEYKKNVSNGLKKYYSSPTII